MAKIATTDVVTNANSLVESASNGPITASCLPTGSHSSFAQSDIQNWAVSGVYGAVETQYTDRFDPDFYINGGTP